MIDHDMPTQQLLLHFGELSRDDILLVRAALRLANSAAAARIQELEEENARLRANNNDLVNRNALLRQRYDLPVDRIPAHKEMQRLQEENASLRKATTVN
jgi:hypothetical protein